MKKSIARKCVMFLKQRKLYTREIREQLIDLFNLYYTEYKNKIKMIPNLELSDVHTDYSLTLEYSYKGIELSLDDLPWFLTRNRYLLNKNCNDHWSYDNMTYTFSNKKDLKKAKRVLRKTYNISSCN